MYLDDDHDYDSVVNAYCYSDFDVLYSYFLLYI